MAKYSPKSLLTQEELNDPDLLFGNADVGDITVGYNALHYRFLKNIPAAVLYNCLCQKAGHYAVYPEQNPRDDGFFYYTAKQFETQTGFGESSFIKAQNILIEYGVIEKKVTYIMSYSGHQTLQKATHFRIIISLTKLAFLSFRNRAEQGLQETVQNKVSIYNKINNKHISQKPPKAVSANVDADASLKEKNKELVVEQTNGLNETSSSLNGKSSAQLTQMPTDTPPAGPPACPPAGSPFESSVASVAPADIADQERKAKNAEITAILKSLAKITRYEHPLQNTTLRQAVKRALNTYTGEQLIKMANVYMDDNGKYPIEKKRLRHFLNDNVLDALDAETKTNTLTPKIDDTLPDYATRLNIWTTAKRLGLSDILALDPNSKDFVANATEIMEGK